MGKIAVVFPGQGAQFVGMGKDFFDEYEAVRDLFSLADKSLGFALSDIMFNGPEDDLKLTSNTQPALLTMSIAIWNLIKGRVNVDAFAGHSLGEYPAVVAGGSVSFVDAVVAVHNRGKFMQAAVPVGIGAMSAVMGSNVDVVREVCTSISSPDSVVELANFNSPSQIVVAGNKDAVERFNLEVKEKGAKRVIMLPVSAPFHCSLMKPAEQKMSDYLDNILINDLSVPVYCNVKAEIEISAADVKANLISQISNTVRWTDLIEKMINDGFDTFIEVGAGTVLSGLIKKINRNVKCINISKLDDISKLEDLNV